MKTVSHWGMHPDEDDITKQGGMSCGVDEEFDEDATSVIDMLCLRGRIVE